MRILATAQFEQSRRGAAIIVVLVCVAVLGTVLASLVQTIAAQQTRLQLRERQLQADCLAQAGLSRARAQLAAGAGYSGEAWQIAAGELETGFPVTVQIAVKPAKGESREIAVVADLSAGSPPVRRSRTVQITTHRGSPRP